MRKNPHAVALGRKGGQVRTQTLSAAEMSRIGRLGGRPKLLTNDAIERLRAEAGAAGDLAQVTICDRALNGSKRARAACLRVMRASEAMQ